MKHDTDNSKVCHTRQKGIETHAIGGLIGWINWNVLGNVYIFTKGKNINAEKNENVELTHTQILCGRLCVFE